MKTKYLFFILFWTTIQTSLLSQSNNLSERKCFVGSTLFMLANLVDDPEPPKYYQLNLGYRVTPKDVISIEIITWNYYEPLGIPYSQKKTAANYPGHVQAYGAGLAYKRFVLGDAYAQVHSTVLRQNYINEHGSSIQKGYQLFNTLRVGYQLRLFKGRFFLEPSIALTFWPVNTNLPSTFQAEEKKWNAHFIGEPGLHFGINF